MKRLVVTLGIWAFVCLLAAETASANGGGTDGEIIEIPVLVNIVKGTNFDPNSAPGMIGKINEVFKPAGIRLVFKGASTITVGNGDDQLNMNERNQLRKKGYAELKQFAKGKKKKGIKISMATVPVDSDPNQIGSSLHKGRLVIVSPNETDPNVTAKTAAHEIVHSLTVQGKKGDPDDQGHSSDPNDLMYPRILCGKNLRPLDVNEMREQGKKWGTCLSTSKSAGTKEKGVARGDGKNYAINAWGSGIDDFNDAFVWLGVWPEFDPCDPGFLYADIMEASAFSDEPFDVNAVVIVEVILNGPLPELTAHAVYTLYIDCNQAPASPGPERYVTIDITTTHANEPNAIADVWDINGAHLESLPGVQVHTNHFLDEGDQKIVANSSLEVPISAEFFGPGSDPFDGIVYLTSMSEVDSDERMPPGVVLMDEGQPFRFGLDNPVAGPSVTVSRSYTSGTETGEHWVYGGGFEPEGVVTVRITPEGRIFPVVEATVTTDTDGDWQLRLTDEIGGDAGAYAIDAVGAEDIDGHIDYATGYFSDEPILADLDIDWDVDFKDFAMLADLWLVGAE